jgi:IclR family transcriptional regulator, acetate operon repressor
MAGERANSMLAGLDERDRNRARRELAAARRNGYAINNQQTETGLTTLGVALRGPQGQVLAGISLAMPTARFAQDKVTGYVRELAACAAAIEKDIAEDASRRLGQGMCSPTGCSAPPIAALFQIA